MAPTDMGPAVTDPQAYRENLFALVGDRDPFDVLSRTASLLDDLVRAHPSSVLRARPFEGKWTPLEIIGHLTDGEWVYGYRVRLVLSEDEPPILGTRQNAWVDRQRHNDRDPAELVGLFRTLRELNLAWTRRLSPTELTRVGRHNERGPESLATAIRMIAGHDLSHLHQIDRYLDAIQQQS